MNQHIVENLFELWDFVGQQNQTLVQTEHWNYIDLKDSDWPKRVYRVQNETEVYVQIKSEYIARKIPGLVTVPEKLPVGVELGTVAVRQKNMALRLSVNQDYTQDIHIQKVESNAQAVLFAKTASQSFGYYVDHEIIQNLIDSTDTIRLYGYVKDEVWLGCGILFIDSKGYAGLHMIGTIPEGRGQGIGHKMTTYLLAEAQSALCPYVVLHASQMGERIYSRLGFETYGVLETYKIMFD
ncbi:GNAT family N-acetyltransferase [bacterium SCSIO 12643]|nr:GNAT family N-acetyltransferase [bacterium SCSIO 12643]